MIKTLNIQNKDIFNGYDTDCFQTADGGHLEITFIKHASLIIRFNEHLIYADPVSAYADFTKFPKADVILITHEHHDHLDPKAIEDIMQPSTLIISNKSSYDILNKGIWIKNHDTLSPFDWISLTAVPAYNITADRLIYHPKNRDNGYVLNLGGSTIYISGDTEDIPEMKDLKDIDIAFISINQPYTMTVQQAIHAIKMIHAGIVYPYHYSDTNLSTLLINKEIAKISEIRIRQLQ